MPFQEMNWKMSHRLQEEFIVPAQAGREEQPLGLGIIPKSSALEGLQLLCRNTVLGEQSLLVAKCQTASMALPVELLERREAGGPQGRVLVGSSARVENTINHPGADSGFPSSTGDWDGLNPGSCFPCCAPEVLISSRDDVSHSASRGPYSCR